MKQEDYFFPRSFGTLEELLRDVNNNSVLRDVNNYNPVLLRSWAERLEVYQLEGPEEKQRVSRMFFEAFGQGLAGVCGCSRIILDHERPLMDRKTCEPFLITTGLMYRSGVFGADMSAAALARWLCACCRIDYKESTLADKLRGYTTHAGYNISW